MSKLVLKDAGGPLQYGVGHAAGVETVHKTLTVLSAARPKVAILSVDATNAFNAIQRQAIRTGVAAHAPVLARTAAAWYTHAAEHHWWDKDGSHFGVVAERGVDQGCPLSPALFSMAVRDKLDLLEQKVRALDPNGKVLAYLDDVYVVMEPEVAVQVLGICQELWSEVGLELNLVKTHVWSPDPTASLPLEIPQVQSLQCLGSTVACVRSAVEAGAASEAAETVAVGATNNPGTEIEEGLRAYIQNLRRLHAAGLSLQHVLVLLRNYAVAAPVHALRANLVSEEWCQAYDELVGSYLSELLEHGLDESQLIQASLPLRGGGCGMTSLASRRGAAFLGSWELCFGDVAAAAGATTAADLLQHCPTVAEALARASEVVRGQGADDYTPDWTRRMGRPRRQVQKAIGNAIDETRLERLLASSPDGAAADVRSAGGSGSAFYARQQRRTI